MKIAFVVTRSDAVGGAQVHVRDMCGALRAAGHEPVVLAGGDGPWFEQLRARQIPLVPLKQLQRAISPVRDLLALFELRRQLRALAPDVVSTHTAKAGVLGRIAAFTLGLPVLFTAHGWTFTEGVSSNKARVWRLIERLVGGLAGRIITVSEFDRRLALEAGITAPERIVAVHNGMPDIDPAMAADPGRAVPRLVMVARFEEQKDHRTLLQALTRLRDLPWQLSFVGGGPLEGAAKALCSELCLSDRVVFLGARTDVAAILAQSQLFVLCTHWEGLPRSIIEAMRAGLPVLATHVAGIPEMVVDGVTGRLCRARDIDHVSHCLRELVTSPMLREQMGARARQRYVEHFQFERMFARTVQIYGAVRDRSGPLPVAPSVTGPGELP